jgi:hypothetical protein
MNNLYSKLYSKASDRVSGNLFEMNQDAFDSNTTDYRDNKCLLFS